MIREDRTAISLEPYREKLEAYSAQRMNDRNSFNAMTCVEARAVIESAIVGGLEDDVLP